MKILFDFQIFSMHQFGGISRYFYELISQAEKDKKFNATISVKYHKNIYLETILKSSTYPWSCEKSLRGFSFPGKGVFCRIYNSIVTPIDPWLDNQRKVIADLNVSHYDVFHPTYYDNYFVDRIKGIPFVLTVHDLINELLQNASFENSSVQKKRNLIFSANHIIAVSERTKEDIVQFYKIPESKISVIYHGNSVDGRVANSVNSQLALPEKYILFVGNRGGYKNFYFFLDAMIEVLKDRPYLSIICTGKPFLDEEKRWMIEKNLPLERIISYQSSEDDLPLLYKKAMCFVFPSLYEGFGLPVLEAFSCGCPVVLSTGGALPEVGGDAALYFDPKSVREIKMAIEKFLDNDGIRKEYIKKGYERASEFSWEKTVQQTSEVYSKVLS